MKISLKGNFLEKCQRGAAFQGLNQPHSHRPGASISVPTSEREVARDRTFGNLLRRKAVGMCSPHRKAKDVLKESTPAGGGFASFFSLQAGTVMAACIIFGINFTSFLYNLSAPNPTEDSGQYASQYVFAYLFFVIAFFGTIAASIAAFKFNSRWVLVAAIILAIAAVIWFLLSILCFIPSIAVYKYVCVHDRCPQTVWLFEVYWRPRSSGNETGQHDKVKDDGETENPTGKTPTQGTTVPKLSDTTIRTHATTAPGEGTEVVSNSTEDVKHNTTNFQFAEENLRSDLSAAESIAHVMDTLERPPRMASLHFLNEANTNRWNNSKSSNFWNWIPWANLGFWTKKRVVSFRSSYVHKAEPGKTDSSIGMSIFCFIILLLFWMYSLWTMFSYYKELREQEKEERELLHTPEHLNQAPSE